jgi:hypothetical protein
MDLILPLKREYFEEIKNGTKHLEYRLCTPYWIKRIEGRDYENVILTLGYPKKDDSSRRIIKPWRGPVPRENITHPHFGDKPVQVFVIDVS